MDPTVIQSQVRRDRFVELLSAHRSRLYGYLMGLVHNTADAEDLFQNVSVILWEKFDAFQPQRGSFMNWACGTAQLEVRNFWRRSSRSVHFSVAMIDELTALQADQFGSTEDPRLSALQGCLLRLAPCDRQLLDDCYGDQFSIKTAANRVGRSADSVYKSLNRIRSALMTCIERRLAIEGRM